jgi:hypothetical protein
MSAKSNISNPNISYRVRCTFFKGKKTSTYVRVSYATNDFDALIESKKSVLDNLYDFVLFEVVS